MMFIGEVPKRCPQKFTGKDEVHRESSKKVHSDHRRKDAPHTHRHFVRVAPHIAPVRLLSQAGQLLLVLEDPVLSLGGSGEHFGRFGR